MQIFLNFLSKVIASFFFVGYFPFASGTAGSFAALVILIIMFYQPYDFSFDSGLLNYNIGGGYINPDYLIYILPICSILFYIIGVWASDRFAKNLKDPDPKKVVIDEVAGMFTSVTLIFLGFGVLISINPTFAVYISASLWYFLAAFLLFRIFDIFKPYPANWVEKNLEGGTAIMLDDIIAAIYTVITFFIIFFTLFATGYLDELVRLE